MREEAWRSRPFAKELRRRMTNAEVILWSRLRYWPNIRFETDNIQSTIMSPTSPALRRSWS